MSGIGTIPASIEPFRIDNVVKASVRLYRDRFALYIGIGLRAILWLFLPIVVVIAMMLAYLLLGVLGVLIGQNWVMVISVLCFLLFIPLVLTSFIYSGAKFSLNSALISRLSFYELCARPETAEQAQRESSRKLWMLWLTNFLLSLIFSTFSAFYQFMNSFSTKTSEIISPIISNSSISFLLHIFLSIFLFILVYIVSLWLDARLSIPDAAMVIESNLNAFDAIERSWYLTRGRAWKIVAIKLLIGAMVLPLFLVALIPLAIGIGSRAIELFAPVSSPVVWLELWPYFLASMLLLLVVTVVILPLGYVLKGVIYYGLRDQKGNLPDS